ncbi:MAG: SAVED domain-containing protein [Anaerolineales bacterium]|nr:MAG: SAVED domain-containing protein [Anaerolineales bacterium]
MDIQLYAKAFFEVVEQINPKLKSVIDAGTSLYTIGSAGVKVLQQGKQLITYAVGKSKKTPTPKSDKPKRKKAAPEILFQKGDVAIVVEISRPAVRDVVNYLESRKIDANLVVITTIKSRGPKPVKGLSESRPAQWTELVREFSLAIDRVKREVGSAKIHIFLSTPLALAFGLGAVWGTVDQAQVYHWKSGGGYSPLMKINRKLRFE